MKKKGGSGIIVLMSQDVCYYAYIIFLVKPLWFASHFLR